MKKILGLFIVMALLLSACGDKEAATSQMVEDAYFLVGELKEINGDSVLIDEEIGGLVWVRLEDGLNLEVAVHSIVSIQYNGVVAESYPRQAQGHSLEVVEPYLAEVVYSYDEMNALLTDGDMYPVVVWNAAKDTVAYATTDIESPESSYRVLVASVYKEEPVQIAYVHGEIPDLNWFYDRLEVQTSEGSAEFGPDFDGERDPLVIGAINTDGMPDADLPMGPTYDLVSEIYEKAEADILIHYFRVENMEGELIQDYINQSLYSIVEVFGTNYEQVKINAEVLRQDEFLTIAYIGRNEALGYDIEKYVTIDVATSAELTVDNVIGDMDAFAELFRERSGYDYETLEGVTVYLENDELIFNFVPLDDSALRTFVKFNLLELAPILDMEFQRPAS